MSTKEGCSQYIKYNLYVWLRNLQMRIIFPVDRSPPLDDIGFIGLGRFPTSSNHNFPCAFKLGPEPRKEQTGIQIVMIINLFNLAW